MVEVKPVAKTVKAESKKTRAEIEETQDLLKNAKKDIIAEIKEVKKTPAKPVKKTVIAKPKALAKKPAKPKPKAKPKKAVGRKIVKIVKGKTVAKKPVGKKARAKLKPVSFGVFDIVRKRSIAMQDNFKKTTAGLKKQISGIDSNLKKQVGVIDKSLRNEVKTLNTSVNKLKAGKTVSNLAKNFNSFRKATNTKINKVSGELKEVKNASLEIYGLKEVAEELKENLDSLNEKVLEGFERTRKPATVQPVVQQVPLQATAISIPEIAELRQLISDLKRREEFEREVQTSLKPSIVKPFVPDEQVAVKLVSLYFEEIARMGFKRSLELDAVINAYMYALERLGRKKIELKAFVPLVAKEEAKLEKETKQEMLSEK